MSRLYDMDPKIIKSIKDELKKAVTTTVWIKKFLEDNKIKRTIRINETFYRKVYEGLSNTTPDLKEETHHQAHEGMVETIIAGCIHKSSFDATHEFFTGEGKNKKDTVDFKVEGKENTYLIEIRSTREGTVPSFVEIPKEALNSILKFNHKMGQSFSPILDGHRPFCRHVI